MDFNGDKKIQIPFLEMGEEHFSQAPKSAEFEPEENAYETIKKTAMAAQEESINSKFPQVKKEKKRLREDYNCQRHRQRDTSPESTISDYYCQLCDAHMNSIEIWESHVSGKRHLKNIVKHEQSNVNHQGPLDLEDPLTWRHHSPSPHRDKHRSELKVISSHSRKSPLHHRHRSRRSPSANRKKQLGVEDLPTWRYHSPSPHRDKRRSELKKNANHSRKSPLRPRHRSRRSRSTNREKQLQEEYICMRKLTMHRRSPSSSSEYGRSSPPPPDRFRKSRERCRKKSLQRRKHARSSSSLECNRFQVYERHQRSSHHHVLSPYQKRHTSPVDEKWSSCFSPYRPSPSTSVLRSRAHGEKHSLESITLSQKLDFIRQIVKL